MRVIKRFILSFLFLMIFWILLTTSDPQELVAGLVISFIITLIFFRNTEIIADLKLSPKAVYFLVRYVFVFLYQLIRSNLDVALRVLNPRLPINPGIVKVRTKLKTRLGRIVLANSITLTPGTLTVETKGDYFYIHWIDVTAQDIDATTEKIVSSFEKYLEVIFG